MFRVNYFFKTCNTRFIIVQELQHIQRQILCVVRTNQLCLYSLLLLTSRNIDKICPTNTTIELFTQLDILLSLWYALDIAGEKNKLNEILCIKNARDWHSPELRSKGRRRTLQTFSKYLSMYFLYDIHSFTYITQLTVFSYTTLVRKKFKKLQK